MEVEILRSEGSQRKKKQAEEGCVGKKIFSETKVRMVSALMGLRSAGGLDTGKA